MGEILNINDYSRNNKKKNRIVTIPKMLKDSSVKVKFSYLALRNMIYYIDKGLRTQTKNNKENHDKTINTIMTNFFDCHINNDSLKQEEVDLIKSTFTTENNAVLPKNDYIFSIEKSLKFQLFALYCDCLTELSFHIGKDYFNKEYIVSVVDEVLNKIGIATSKQFSEFVSEDVLETLKLLEEM